MFGVGFSSREVKDLACIHEAPQQIRLWPGRKNDDCRRGRQGKVRSAAGKNLKRLWDRDVRPDQKCGDVTFRQNSQGLFDILCANDSKGPECAVFERLAQTNREHNSAWCLHATLGRRYP